MRETNLNSELLAAEARGRKHIPFAVFAVIVVHIVLFLVLLVAAGCRAKARAKMNGEAPAALAASATPEATPVLPDPSTTVSPSPANQTPVTVIHPPAQQLPVALPRSDQSTEITAEAEVYVVKPGDNLDAIARRHGTTVRALKTENKLKSDLIRPGQQLRVSRAKAASSTRRDA